ncbi:TPA: hypothetical protein RQJ54_004446 [Vibrio vulnificus]|uniref:hypothetical protein n=1 Tax=Vibrio vulnificus TaxID=672 RepID=UPI001FAEB4F5|nr:hypothetical protein [Vibrio vulnificus]EHU5196733.1 hypothetical protein [Vibrio vulnificus]MCJ0806788.1 hypothetical protein [Vibrio vulnificus]MCU8124531.1 hypothetical protein [Vibrio vulnificus]MDK2644094.1 hypothetical protein [Vibrio vulnificus]MDK2668862.1 hypothetical protein [Vibrio vulnificus]
MQQVVWFGVTPLLPLLLSVLLYVVVGCGKCVSKRVTERVDEWFPVCTGMTAGGVVAVC